MRFNLIYKENWTRKQNFHRYLNNVRRAYIIIADIDITDLLIKLKNNNIKLFPTLIYMAVKVINKHEEFRTCFDESGNFGCLENI